MTYAQIFEGVRAVLQQHLKVQREVSLDTDITRDLLLDSIQQLTLIVELENLFKICFSPDDERNTETLGDLVQLIARRLDEDSVQPHAAQP